ncbi:MAG: PilX N-terminal domain-containing pilus assembly protein, partial [Acidobacteriota bacterium]
MKIFNTKIAAARSNQAGVALAIVALVLLLLTVLVVSAHYTMVSQSISAGNYRNSTQAFYVAEAGIQRTIDWFSHHYNPPDWTQVVPSFLPLNSAASPALLLNGDRVTMESSGITTLPASLNSLVTDFRNHLDATNNFTTSATGNLRGEYNVKITLLTTGLVKDFVAGFKRSERWRIESTGVWRNGAGGNILASASNVAVIETVIRPVTTNAVCADTIKFNGGAYTVDTYDSSLGTYAATRQDNGSVGAYTDSNPPTSPAPYDLGPPGVQIGGTLNIPEAYQNSSLCAQAGGNCAMNFCARPGPIASFCTGSALGPPVPLPGPTYLALPCPAISPCPIPLINGGNINSDSTLTLPGASTFAGDACFWFGNITLAGNDELVINNLNRLAGSNGKLNVYINSLSTTGNAQIRVVSNKNNPVNLYIKSSLNAGGNAFANAPENAQGLFVFYEGTATVTYSGTTDAGLVLYAPNASVTTISGNANIYGAIITKSFEGNGNIGIHFDRDLE